MNEVDEAALVIPSQRMTRRLVDEFQPAAIIPFGSYAWGTSGEYSDVDLLMGVSASDVAPPERAARAYGRLHGVSVPLTVLFDGVEPLNAGPPDEGHDRNACRLKGVDVERTARQLGVCSVDSDFEVAEWNDTLHLNIGSTTDGTLVN